MQNATMTREQPEAGLKEQPRFITTDLALIAVFAALISACSLISIGGAVPITLQTLAVVLAGLVLGPWRGGLAALLYLVLGFANLPVFAGGTAGVAVLQGPSAGYLLSFPLVALVAGLIARWAVKKGFSLPFAWFIVAAMVASLCVNHPLGILRWSLLPGWDLPTVLAFDLLFLPGDIAKNVAAAGIAIGVHKAFPTLLSRPMWGRPDRSLR